MNKRKIALFLVLVLSLSMLSSFALAGLPTAKLSCSSSVKRGKKIQFVFNVNSSSYSMQSGKHRAGLETYIFYKKVNWSEGAVAKKGWTFSGKGNLKWNWKVPKKASKGKYVNFYGTIYRSSIYGSWQLGTSKTKKFTVK